MSGKRREEHEEEKQLNRIERNTIEILGILSRKKLSRGQVNLMAKTIDVGGTSLATLTLLDQNGKPMTINTTYTVAPSASNPGNVSFGAVNPDGSFVVTGVAPDAGDIIGAVVTRPDAVQITLTADTLTINAVVQTLTSGAVVLT